MSFGSFDGATTATRRCKIFCILFRAGVADSERIEVSNLTMQAIRDRSSALARDLGYQVNRGLPLLDPETVKRSVVEIAKRALGVLCAVTVANGRDPGKALAWLRRHDLLSTLTLKEQRYLESPSQDLLPYFLAQEEALWALAWAGGLHDRMEFNEYCSPTSVQLFPGGTAADPLTEFSAKLRIRDSNEILEALDLAYCLHNSMVSALVDGVSTPSAIEGYVVVERRRALEWVMSNGNWDDIRLDT